jgi:hypothetical protein
VDIRGNRWAEIATELRALAKQRAAEPPESEA